MNVMLLLLDMNCVLMGSWFSYLAVYQCWVLSTKGVEGIGEYSGEGVWCVFLVLLFDCDTQPMFKYIF